MWKAFSSSAQLARNTNYSMKKHFLAWQGFSMFWMGEGTKPLAQEANDGEKPLAIMAAL